MTPALEHVIETQVNRTLIRSGRTALHRRLGVAGAVLAAAVPFAGLLATAGVVARVVAIGIDLNADASVLVGIGVSGVPVVQFLSGVVMKRGIESRA